ncbi:hypothetical protein GCM10025870_25510 [Agromyces marinus]|uniref:Uncharacterized protein n=1 Tax=Agromyces marinus TaxID=1389020 RepID=A0ABM8H3U6_9MICO|nr:hypothetical protein GCM10025870_25510 [Agromyces marinus]
MGARQDVPGWAAWTVLALVVAGLGAAVTVRSRRAVPPADGRGAPAAAPGPAPVAGRSDAGDDLDRRARLDAAISSIPADAREHLLADRRRAIEWLRLQGTISPDVAARALRAPLGRSSTAV